MAATRPLTGVYCPNLVPFDARGRIDERELRRLVSWLIGRGIHGLYPNGSTGEFIRLSFEERLRVVEIVVDEAAGRVPVLAGAAEGNLEMALRAAERYRELGCVAISATGPYYYKVSPESVEYFFRELAEQSPIDILLYNIPQFANEIPVPVIRRLAQECPRIIGVKDSSRDMPRFVSTLNAVKPVRADFTVFIGCEEILFPSLVMGGDGGTMASSGVVPEALVGLYASYRRGDWDACRDLQFKILELIEAMLRTGNFPDGFRLGAGLRGFAMGESRQPLGPQGRAGIEEMGRHIACILTSAGYPEAASACRRHGGAAPPAPVQEGPARPAPRPKANPAASAGGMPVEAIVREVMRNLNGK